MTPEPTAQSLPYRLFQERITRTPGGFRHPQDPENDERFGRLEPINPGLKVLREMFFRLGMTPTDRKIYDPVYREWENPDPKGIRTHEDYAAISPDAPTGTIGHEATHHLIDQIVKTFTAGQKKPLRILLEDPSYEAMTRGVADPLNYNTGDNQINFNLLAKVLSQGTPQQQEFLTKLIRLRQQGNAARNPSSPVTSYAPIGISSNIPPARRLK